MPAKTKKKSKKVHASTIERDYSNDPLVIKKRNQVRELIEKYGFPEELGYGSRRKTKV